MNFQKVRKAYDLASAVTNKINSRLLEVASENPRTSLGMSKRLNLPDSTCRFNANKLAKLGLMTKSTRGSMNVYRTNNEEVARVKSCISDFLNN